MNHKEIGAFLKTLRKQQNLSQEQLAEALGISARTVSRWETGSNLPDLDTLIRLADFYNVELRELLEGKHRDEAAPDTEGTVRKMADYSREVQRKLTKQMHIFFLVGTFSLFVSFLMEILDLETGFLWDFFRGLTLGVAQGVLILGVLFTSRHMEKLKAFKLQQLEKIRSK